MATNDATAEVTNIQAPVTDGDVTGIQPPAPPRGGFAEVGTGLARGALADLPTMAGQALQFAGANNVGSTVRSFGQGMAAQPWLTMQPESHSGVTNFLAQGAEQVGAIAPAVAAGAGAAMLGAPALLATGVGAATGGALMAGQAGQTTLEAAQAKGLSPEAAQSASRLNAASTFATQVGLGMVGGKVLGVAGNALGKAVGSEAAPLADQVLNQLTGANGWLGQGLKQGAIGAAEATGIGAVQAGTSAAINNAYGIDDKSPLAAAAEAIPQMLSMSAILTPLGLASRALQVRAAAARTATLASETTDPALRQKLADQYTNALPTSVAQQAFAENAKTAIDNNLPLKVDTGLFQNGAVPAPPAPEVPQPGPQMSPTTPQGENGALFGDQPPPAAAPGATDLFGNPTEQPAAAEETPQSYPQPGQRDMFDPNGNLLRDSYDVKQEREAAVKAVQDATSGPTASTQDFINQMTGADNGTMTAKQRTARQADLTAALNEPSGVFVSDATDGTERQLSMGELAQQRASTYDNSDAPRDTAKDAMADAATKPVPGVSAQDMINNVTGVGRDGLSKSQQAKRRSDAKAALDAPSGTRVSDPETGIERELTMGELYDLRNQPVEAPAAPAPEPAPGSAKTPDAITADITAANKARNGSDTITKSQSIPAQKQLDKLGIDKMGTHQEQIDALAAHLSNDDAKIGPATRELLGHLLAKWQAEVPQAEKPIVASPEVPQGDTLVHTPEDATAAGAGAISAMTRPGVDPGAAGDALRAQQLADLKARTDAIQNAAAAARAADQRINGEAPAAEKPSTSTALSTKVTPTETADQVVNDQRPIAFHPKDYNEALGDAYAANAKLGLSDKPRAVGPTMDKLKEIGVVDINGNTPHTHDEQIAKLDAYLADKSNKMGDTLRSKLTELSRQWKADMPYSDEAGRQQYVGELAEKATIPRPISPGSEIMIADKRESYLRNLRGRAEDAGDTHMMSTVDAAMPQAQARDNADHMAHMERSMMRGARQELDAALANGKISQADAQRIAAGAQQTGNGISAAFHVSDQLDARIEQPQLPQLPQNIPDSVQAASPGNDAALPDNLTQSPRSHAQDTAGMVDATLKNFEARIQGGEKLKPLEQERYEDLQAMAHQLADVVNGKTNNAAFSQSISDLAREAATKPYTESYRKNTDPTSRINPGVLDAIGGTRKLGALNDVLDHIAQNGATDEARGYAKFLRGLNLDTKIMGSGLDHPDTEGMYYPKGGEYGDQIMLHNSGLSEQTILHEATHAAQQSLVSQAQEIVTPKTQREAELKQALTTIESIRQKAIERAGADAHYGLTNAHEFLAELNTNPEFQRFLKSELVNGKQSLWQRAVGAVKSLLGLKTGDMLSRAMEANESFFQKPNEAGFPLRQGSEPAALFRKSPTDATKVADDQLSKIAGLADKLTDKIDVTNLNQKAYRALASWKTVQYLADRIRAMPEMVQSGFAKGLDAYQQAHESRRIANMFVTKPIAAYADRVQKMLGGLGDSDKAREVSRQMATIGGEASRGGFDYRMNYADNVKAGRELPAANKAYIDDMHRQFTQLQRTNPDAAKSIVDGQLLNHKTLVNTTSTLARNLMEIASGSYTKLAADLTRMAPDDAARAAAEARVQGALPAHEMARAHAGKLDIMDKSLESARNTKPETFADGSTQALDARLNGMFADARKLPQGSALRGHMNELEQMYRAQAQNPYFALGRSGDYFVKASLKGVDEATQQKIQDALKGTNKVAGNLVGNDGNVFFRVDSQDQAKGLHDKLLQAAGTKMVAASNAWGKLAYNDPSFVQGTSPALRQMLADLHSTVENSGMKGGAADAMRETVTRSLLSMLPETSSRSAKMSRQGVPGYDADFLGNFSRRAMGSVQDMSNIYTQRAFDDSFNQMRASSEQMNRTGTAQGRIRATDTMDEITKRYANDRKSVDNTTINTINSLGHAFYLAMSPAYLIRTTAQPFHRALPLLGSRYGMVNSAKEIGGATGVSLKIMAATLKSGWQADGARGVLDAGMDFKNKGLSPTEEAFVQELHDRGTLNLGQTRQLQNMALGGTQRQQDLQRMASMTAQYAEMTNRLATGLAAFRLAEKGSRNVTQAGREANTEYAIAAIDRAMDNFDSSNTARAISKNGFAGKATPLLTAFMNYNLQTMQQISRTVHDGMFNQDKSAEGMQRASEARKEFGGLMATTMMISGAMGLPFANVFAGLWNTYKDATDPNNPGDIRIDAENFLANTFGKTAGGMLAHGLPHGANFDSSTFGLENLMPGSEFLSSRRMLADRLSEQSAALMGPALNGGLGILQAMDKMKDGYWAKGLEAALPSGLKPYFKAAELATRGYTDSKENPIPLKATGWDVGLQAAGFHTATRATELEGQEFAGARNDRVNYQKGLIQDRFYKAVTTKDPDALESAKGDMMAFNTANPMSPITNVQSGISNRLTGIALGQILGVGMPITAKQLPVLSNRLAFARDGAMPGE